MDIVRTISTFPRILASFVRAAGVNRAGGPCESGRMAGSNGSAEDSPCAAMEQERSPTRPTDYKKIIYSPPARYGRRGFGDAQSAGRDALEQVGDIEMPFVVMERGGEFEWLAAPHEDLDAVAAGICMGGGVRVVSGSRCVYRPGEFPGHPRIGDTAEATW